MKERRLGNGIKKMLLLSLCVSMTVTFSMPAFAAEADASVSQTEENVNNQDTVKTEEKVDEMMDQQNTDISVDSERDTVESTKSTNTDAVAEENAQTEDGANSVADSASDNISETVQPQTVKTTQSEPKQDVVSGSDNSSNTESGTTEEPKKTYKPRFATENGKKYFYNETGEKVKNEVFSYGGNYYYADKNGIIPEMKLIKFDGEVYYAHEGGKLVVNDFMNVQEGKATNRYYFNSEAKAQKNGVFTAKKDNKKYYADKNGVIPVMKLFKYNNEWYYAHEKGCLVVNDFMNVQSGKTTNRYYFGGDGKAVHNGIFTIKSGKHAGTYYADPSTAVVPVMKLLTINKELYYAHEKGRFVKNDFMNVQSGKTTNRYYFGGDGKAVHNGVFTIKSGKHAGTYYANPSNAVIPVMRLLTINNELYYAHEKGRFITNDFMNVPSGNTTKRYYFNGSGKAVKNGFYSAKGIRFYAYSDGNIPTWQLFTINGKTYYAHERGSLVKNDFMNVGSYRYYFGSDYTAQKDGFYDTWRGCIYINKNGHVLRDDWLNYNGKWYYAQSTGALYQYYWKYIDGLWYHFGPHYYVDQTSKTNPLDPMVDKAQGYSSNTNYLILVNRSEHRVCIYYGSKWNWTRIKDWYCGNGKSSTPTIAGEFSIPSKYPRSQPYFDSGSARCWYPTRIYGGYLFHSVLYYQSGSPSRVMDGRLGVGVSHGCVRLALDNAKWIYDNIPIGTKVVIYN